EADDVALLHVLADLHLDLREVAVERADAVSVVELHVTPVGTAGARGHHPARGGRLDGRARDAADVDAVVMLAHAGPRRAPRPEARVERSADGPAKRQRRHELAGPAHQRLEVAEALVLLGDAHREQTELVAETRL